MGLDVGARGGWRTARSAALAGIAFVVLAALDPGRAAAEAGPCAAPLDHAHAAWTGLLRRYVSAGAVDYGSWKSGGAADLDRYLKGLHGVCRSQHDGWTRDQKLAYWINLYNATTIDLVLDAHPTPSIMEIGGSRGAVFKLKVIPLRALRGESLSLDDVENAVIRPQFREPRVHFALVCAAKSCPRLRAEAFRADVLERQLDEQTRDFVRDPRANRYDARAGTLRLSRIFEWYADDFRQGGGTVASFVARYLGGEAAAAVAARPPRLEYLEYDWSLNGR